MRGPALAAAPGERAVGLGRHVRGQGGRAWRLASSTCCQRWASHPEALGLLSHSLLYLFHNKVDKKKRGTEFETQKAQSLVCLGGRGTRAARQRRTRPQPHARGGGGRGWLCVLESLPGHVRRDLERDLCKSVAQTHRRQTTSGQSRRKMTQRRPQSAAKQWTGRRRLKRGRMSGPGQEVRQQGSRPAAGPSGRASWRRSEVSRPPTCPLWSPSCRIRGSVPRDTSQHLPSPSMGGRGNDIGDGTRHGQPAGRATTGSV